MKERLVERNKPITEPIKKNNLPTLNVHSKKVVSKDKARVGVLTQDCQTRDGNLEDFFKFKNQPWPPSLSETGSSEEGRKQILSNACQIVLANAPHNQLSMLPFLMGLS